MATQPAEHHSSSTTTGPASIDIEKQQEEQLRAKYPTVGLKGSTILQKKMQSKVKYFDSGDYNMALSKQMALAKAKHAVTSDVTSNANQETAPPPASVTESTAPAMEAVKGPVEVVSQPVKPTTLASTSGTASKDSAGGEHHVTEETSAQHHTPPVAVLLAATASVAQELLQQQVSHSSDEDIGASKAVPGAPKMSRSESIREVTGDTMATPDNVSAIVRKKSMLNPHGRPVISSSPPSGISAASGHRPSVSNEISASSN
jgi:hypothetical protein